MNGHRRTRIVLRGLLALALASACESESETTKAATIPEAPSADAAPAESAAPKIEAEAAPKDEAPKAEAAPPSGHAIAKVGALLFSSSTDDVGFELPPLGEDSLAAGMTVNVVGEQDGRLVVETLVAEPPEHHCAATLSGISDFRLRLYLSANDLVPVLTEDFVREAADGTKLRVSRGVPVPSGSTTLMVRGTKIEGPVPPESLGRFYAPAEAHSRDRSGGTLHPLAGHPLTVDGVVLDETGLFRDSGGLLRFASTPKGDDALVTVRNPCLEATALVSGERLRAGLPAGRYAIKGPSDPLPAGIFAAGAFGPAPTGELAYEVKAGAAILWPDGRPAGQVTATHGFATKPRDESGRMCFDAPLTTGHATTLALCFAASDVGELAAAPAGATAAASAAPSGGGPGLASAGKVAKKRPHISTSKPAVTGTLDKEVIRRIVRAHVSEVRYCYEQGLMKKPGLSGKVSITFTIDTKGGVAAAKIADDTLGDAAVGNCIVKAVKRWMFPKPTGGIVVVTYPFVLEPG